jgi:hypothetical protein
VLRRPIETTAVTEKVEPSTCRQSNSLEVILLSVSLTSTFLLCFSLSRIFSQCGANAVAATNTS